jgi:hypothetical protein
MRRSGVHFIVVSGVVMATTVMATVWLLADSRSTSPESPAKAAPTTPAASPESDRKPTEAEIGAYKESFAGYCKSVEDVLDTGAHAVVHDDPTRESLLLKWGREQGLKGLADKIPLSERRQSLDLVYQEIRRRYLPDATLAENAPDAGVKVTVGEPRVVMWAPEGKTADIAGEKYRLRHLGGSIAAEGRWGQYMFPQISKIRGGMLVVQVYVGGDSPGGRNYLYYVSDDKGKTWRHFTVYNDAEERPANEIALRLSDGEELRGPLDRDYQTIEVS